MATNTSDFFTYSATAGTAKNLQKPQDGGDNNQWGNFINVDLDEIVAAVNALSDKIADANEKTLVDFTATGSAVNHVGITNAATGNPPQISSAGSDTNVDLTLTAKGTGDINLTPGTNGDVNISKVDIDGGAIDGVTIGTNDTVTELRVDNLKIDGNVISSTNPDGDIDLSPNGAGSIDLNSGTLDLSAQTVDVTLNAAVDALNFDSNTLSIDASNNRIGIGTAAPDYKIDIRGTGNDTFQVKNGAGAYGRINPDSNGANADIRFDFEGGSGSETGMALIFRNGTTERFRIQGTGNATITGGNLVIGTAGKGITFGGDPDSRESSATAGGRTLDDYEEGTFTATMNQATIGTNAQGYYTKIGNLVFFSIFVTGVTPTSGQSAILKDLPFMPGSDTEQFAAVAVAHNGLTDEDAAYVSQNNNRVVFTTGTGTATYNTSSGGRNCMVAGSYII